MSRRAPRPEMARLVAVWLCFGAWAGLIGWRLYDLQIARHGEYVRRAERQQQRVVDLDPPRGTIYDARGRELAVSVEVESAFAVPRDVENPQRTARALAALLDLDAARLERQLSTDREFVWLARKLDPPQAAQVRRLDLAGVHLLPESKRYYPHRELAASVLGYVGTDNHGLGGLESSYDKRIAGRPGRRTVLRDARRGTVVSPVLSFAEAEPGEDLRLTIDATLQFLLERELEAVAEATRARGASAVILDPESGAVLAMASWPGFDPNDFAEASAEDRRNRAIQDAHEPGSTFKMITAAAALEANLVDPADRIDCEMGGVTVLGQRINDHKPFGVLTMREVMAFSSNVGAIKVGLRAGAERLHATLRDFGFGRPTGIDLPGESAGIVPPLARWVPLTKAYVSFGHGISATSLQLAAAFAAVGNGGRLVRPHLVAGGGEGASPALVASPATLRSLERMLEAVVIEGTGKRAGVEGYTVAGKTGTAEKVVAGGYAADRHVASFAGFAPARDPVIAGVVVIDEPKGGLYHGGEVAAPVFGNFARQALVYLDVPADRDRQDTWPRQRQSDPADSTDAPGATRLASLAHRPANAAGEALAHRTPGQVPDLSGLAAREAVQRAALAGLRTNLVGHGFVERQSPAPGTLLSAGSNQLEVWLGPRAG